MKGKNKCSKNVNWKGGVWHNYAQHKFNKFSSEILALHPRCHFCPEPATTVVPLNGKTYNTSRKNLIPSCPGCVDKVKPKYTSKYRRQTGQTLKEIALAQGVTAACISYRLEQYGTIYKPRQKSHFAAYKIKRLDKSRQ